MTDRPHLRDLIDVSVVMEDQRAAAQLVGRLCECGGRFGVLNSIITRSRASRIRYIGCRKCGYRPPKNKLIVPLIYAPPRVTATHSNESLAVGRGRA